MQPMLLLRFIFAVVVVAIVTEPIALCAPVDEADDAYGNARKQFAATFGQRPGETALGDQQRQQQQQPMVREDYYGPQEALGWHPRYLSPRPMSKRLVYWQPMKRAVYWQPMKRNEVDREEILMMLEERLSDVLRAGEVLGVSADEIFNHLKSRNGAQNQ